MPGTYPIHSSTDSRTDRAGARFRGRVPWLISSLVAGSALLALTACGGTPAAPSQPTVQTVATQAAGAAASGAATAQTAASPVAATAQAAASPAIATVQAGASPAAATVQAGAAPVAATAASVVGTAISAVPSPSPSPAAQAPLRIADASLADATPWLSIQNDGSEPVDVGGWSLQVGSVTAALPEEAVVQPHAALTIHAGEGMSSDDELYLGNLGDALASAALPGTPVRLADESGRVVTEVTVPRF